MNCASAGEVGGSAPLVAGGRTFVGFPGAPGWTTTGAAGSVCCAWTRKENKLVSAVAAANAAMLNTTRIFQLFLIRDGLTCSKCLIILSVSALNNYVFLYRKLSVKNTLI